MGQGVDASTALTRVQEVEHGVFTPIVLSTTGRWALKLQHSIEDWQMEFHERRESHIQSSWGGFDVVSPSILLSCAFTEADLLVTTLYMNKTFLLLHQRAVFPLPRSEVCCLLFFSFF